MFISCCLKLHILYGLQILHSSDARMGMNTRVMAGFVRQHPASEISEFALKDGLYGSYILVIITDFPGGSTAVSHKG